WRSVAPNRRASTPTTIPAVGVPIEARRGQNGDGPSRTAKGGVGRVWFVSFRDLVFRRRRFAIAILGTAGVFAMALVLAGVASGFTVEADRTLAGIGADSWVVPAGVAGPFTSFRTMPATTARRVAAEPGVREAVPFV